MIKFKDFFKQKQPKKLKSEMKARHMHPIGLDPNSHPKHPGRFVPKMHQVKQDNPKLTRMKSGQSKREVLASCDVKQIIRQFSISPDINNPKKLGNTGIVMRYDQRYKKFILESNRDGVEVMTAEGIQRVGVTKIKDNWWKKVSYDGAVSYHNNIDCSESSYHRLDGPAFVESDKSFMSWWVNGERHRLDGPAKIINRGGRVKNVYYIHNEEYTKEDFDKYILKFGGAENTQTALDLLDI
jgi:hypothetical protein